MSDIDTTQSPSSVFYGYFSKYTWRNEKNGNSFFRIVTKQELFFEQQYCKKEVKKNPITEQEETLYTIYVTDPSIRFQHMMKKHR